jgi:hypothetical protein
MSDTRHAPTREALAALTTAAGLALDDTALDALLRPTAAVYAAVDSLDLLDLAETEPAAAFALPPPVSTPNAAA